MAHYAFLNMSNIVTEVIVGKDETDGNLNWNDYDLIFPISDLYSGQIEV